MDVSTPAPPDRGVSSGGTTSLLGQPRLVPNLPVFSIAEIAAKAHSTTHMKSGIKIPLLQEGRKDIAVRNDLTLPISTTTSTTTTTPCTKQATSALLESKPTSSSASSLVGDEKTTSMDQATPPKHPHHTKSPPTAMTTVATGSASVPSATNTVKNNNNNTTSSTGYVSVLGNMIGGACQGATPTSLPQPIGAALRPPWPSATIEGLAPYAGLYSLLTVSAATTHVTTTTTTSAISATAAAAPRSPAPPPMSPLGVPITTPMAGVVATHAVLAQLHALCVQQKDGALAGALPPILPAGQMAVTPTMLESISQPSHSVLKNNENTINNNNSSGPKSTFSVVTTVPASRCVTVGSRDDLRMSLASNVSKAPVVTSKAAARLNHKKPSALVTVSAKVSGRITGPEQTSAAILKSSLNCAKEEKDKLISVPNTKRTVEQPLNCKMTSRTLGSQQPSCPVSSASRGGDLAAPPLALRGSLSPMATYCDSESSYAVNNVPVAEKDKVRVIQNHKLYTSQVPLGKMTTTHLKTSAADLFKTSEPKTVVVPESLVCNGTNNIVEVTPAMSVPSSSTGLEYSDNFAKVKPKVVGVNTVVSPAHQYQSVCDLSIRSENKEFTDTSKMHAVEPLSLSNKTKNQYTKGEEVQNSTGDASGICVGEQQQQNQQLHQDLENLSNKIITNGTAGDGNGNHLSFVIGDQCSRTTPGLHEPFVQGRKVKPRTQHMPVTSISASPVPVLSPANTPVSVGDASSACPPIVALTQLTVPRVAPPATAAAGSTGANGDSTSKTSRKPSRPDERPIVAAAGGGSIPVGIAVARQRQEPRPPEESLGPLPNGAPTTQASAIPPAHWPLPPTPCTPGIPSTPFWLPQSQFAGVGVDTSVGAGMGLGYQFVRDPLSGHYYVLPHPHAIPDPSGHSLVWAGYGGVAAAPPVVMPQQILALSDYHRNFHPTLVHVPHPHAPVHSPTPAAIKREDPPTSVTPEEDPKSQSIVSLSTQGSAPPGTEINLPSPISGLRHLPPPPFLYPPASTLPYYLPQSPHGPPFSLSPYPLPPTSTIGSSGLTSSLPNSLTTTLTDTVTPQGNITTTYSVLPAAPVTSVAKGSGLEHCASKGCESLVATASPAPRSDSSEPINVTSHSEEEPDVESPVSKSQPSFTPLGFPVPFKIKQEIKEEIPSPVGSSKEDSCSLGITDPNENHIPPKHMVTIKKEALIGCEGSDPGRDIESHNGTVFVSHINQLCPQSIASGCTTLISSRFSDSDLPLNTASLPHSVSASVVCQESQTIPGSDSQVLDFSTSQRTTCFEPAVPLHIETEHVDSTEPQRMVSLDPCDRIPSETHSHTNLESSSTVTTSSKALIVNSSNVSVFSDSKPSTVVHPVPQRLPDEEAVECGLPDESSSIVASQDEAVRVTEGESQKAHQSSYLDLSGLELLSQSVLQHANRLSSMSPDHASVESSSPYRETVISDCASQTKEPTEECSSIPSESLTTEESSSSPEKVPIDTCSSDETSHECSIPSEQSETESENSENVDENVQDSYENHKDKEFLENSSSESLCEKKDTRDRMPELVQACLSELPCSPTSPGSPAHDQESAVVAPESSANLEESPAATSMPDRISGLHGLSLLCALAEQRIMEEEHVACPALSSLADVAATSPSVPTHQPIRSPSPQPGPSFTSRPVCARPFGSLSNNAVFGATTFGTIPSSFTNAYTTPVKSTDVNRNYKSPESEREAKAFIANKASQYQKDAIESFKSPSGFPVDSMDETELDMRMQLAELQRKYRETQRELSRLPPKKIASSPIKRGPGRPPKRKIINNDVIGKKKVGRPPLKRKSPQKELSPPVLERVTDLDLKDIKDTDDEKDGNRSSSRSILKPPVLTATFTNQKISDENHSPKTIETQGSTEKEESSDDDAGKFNTRRWSVSSEDTAPPCLGSPFKLPVSTPETRQEESEEEPTKDIPADTTSQDLKVLNIETSVESSPSDLEQQSTSSSASKKRKPGRPKKHSPTKEDATETIVAKKPKTLNFLLHRPLLTNKSKMRPKLKAEVKIREEEEEDNIPRPHYAISSNTDPSSQNLSEDEDDHKPNVRLASVDACIVRGGGARKRGCPRGRASLTRRAMLRDKEKRKSAAEKQSHMEALYRSLKRHSTVAAAEHDESEDEKDKEEKETETQEPLVRHLSGLGDSSGSDHEASHKPAEGYPISSSSCSISTVTTTITTAMMTTATVTVTTTTSSNEAPRPTMQTPEPSVCVIEMGDLVDKARVLVLQDGLLYAGHVVPITPPDVYGVVIDGERGSRPHIYCREELLNQSWKEVKPGSSRFLVEGTRVCAFWSQQYRALYPGCIAASSSPAHEANHNFVNVEFDDGDSGKIHVDDIRLLPTDFPVIEHDPNPLMTLNKRKRRPTGDSHCSDIREDNPKAKQKKVRTYSGTSVDSEFKGNDLNDPDDENHEVEKENKSSTVNIEKNVKEGQGKVQNKKNDKKKHKKHKHTDSSHHHRHKHRNKHKHRYHEGDRPLPHVEPGVNELTMRIKSPPPPLSESQRQRQASFLKDSDSEDETSSKSPSDEESEGNDSEYTPTKKEVGKGPARKKKRHPSGKSKIAPFLPERQLWRWSGKGFKRPGAKGKGKKEFFKAIVRGKEKICVEDCAVFLSAGQPDRPYIGKIEHMWESWGGNMVVKVKWFYHPQETKGLGRRLTEPKGALFQSPHTDENDVQTISHKCDVIALSDYRIRRGELESRYGPNYENCDVYYLAGSYDPISGHITMEPGVS